MEVQGKGEETPAEACYAHVVSTADVVDHDISQLTLPVTTTMAADEGSLLDKLDAVAPTPLRSFDAFPKLPASYKSRSESRGLFTVLIGLVAFFLILNDISEFVWGWPDYEFGVDASDAYSFMNVNVDMVVAMPCRYLSVDLRDVVGDRLYLSKGFRRDGTLFDVGQATKLREHQRM